MEIEQCMYTVKKNFEVLYKIDAELCAEAFHKEELDHSHCQGLGRGAVVKERLTVTLMVPFKQKSWI